MRSIAYPAPAFPSTCCIAPVTRADSRASWAPCPSCASRCTRARWYSSGLPLRTSASTVATEVASRTAKSGSVRSSAWGAWVAIASAASSLTSWSPPASRGGGTPPFPTATPRRERLGREPIGRPQLKREAADHGVGGSKQLRHHGAENVWRQAGQRRRGKFPRPLFPAADVCLELGD